MENIVENPKIVDDAEIVSNKSLYGKKFYVLASLSRDKYIRFPEEKLSYIKKSMQVFNGSKSLEEISLENPNINFKQLYEILKKDGFIENYYCKNNEINLMTKEILCITFPKISEVSKSFLKAFVNIMQLICFILLVISFIVFLMYPINMVDMKKEFALYHRNIMSGTMAIIIVSIVSMLLHELSHILTAIKYGRDIEKISLNLYIGIMPICYVKCKGLNILKTTQKLHVVLAGIMMNFFLAIFSLALITCGIFQSDVNAILKLMFWGNLFAGCSNLIPVTLSDGYFALSIVLDKYDLKAYMFRSMFSKKKLKKKNIAIYLIYFVVMILSISMIIYSAIIYFIDLVNGLPIYIQVIILAIIISYISVIIIGTFKKIISSRRYYEN